VAGSCFGTTDLVCERNFMWHKNRGNAFKYLNFITVMFFLMGIGLVHIHKLKVTLVAVENENWRKLLLIGAKR
jgi:hypothetical protein